MEPVAVGVDPGQDGGVGLIRLDGSSVLSFPMPVREGGGKKGTKKDIDVPWLLSLLNHIGEPKLVAVEQVHSMPKQGVASSFLFGKGYGKILGALEAAEIPFELVPPQRWKSLVLHGTSKDKEAAIQYVQKRFPGVSLLATEKCRTPHDGMAESLCLAEYARRLLVGK